MAEDVISGYAEALLAIADAEGGSERYESELAQVARAVEGSGELQAALADASTPVARRQQIIEDVLGGQATRVAIGMVSLVVAAGRAGDLGRISDRMIEMGAAARGNLVAEVRSAIPLDTTQEQKLTAALKASTGKDVELKVVIDPSVMGGLVTQIGDQIIDGSVRTRLGQLRDAF